MASIAARDEVQETAKILRDFNRLLEDVSSTMSLNEEYLEQKVSELEEIGTINGELYWLTHARVNELTLLCAGNYANNFEFTAAGDLLVNPRCIRIHIKNRIRPVIKKRHSKLTDQFRSVASTRGEVIQWLKKETLLEIKKEPLLPYLYESLKKSGTLSQEYLLSIDRRMKQIADVIVLLWSLHLPDSRDFQEWLHCKTQSEKEFINSRLCNFDTRVFYELGHDIKKLIQYDDYKSKFLLTKS